MLLSPTSLSNYGMWFNHLWLFSFSYRGIILHTYHHWNLCAYGKIVFLWLGVLRMEKGGRLMEERKKLLYLGEELCPYSIVARTH